MNDSREIATPSLEQPTCDTPVRGASSMQKFTVACLALLVVFSWPLWQLARFALHSELYSHTLLMPLVSVVLIWFERDRWRAASGAPVNKAWAAALLAGGAALLGWYLALKFSPGAAARQNEIALSMYALALLVGGGACWCWPKPMVTALAFPLALLVFLAPFPVGVEEALESFLQHNSARVAHVLFQLAGMPVFRDETYFRLPGFSLEVAPECSGIHSTLALFITSLVAGRLLLHSPWKRVALAVAVVPLALVRNGFCVVVIGELCVRIGPHMIDSYIHRHGGPVFFVLSLVPFSLLLYFLLKFDRRSARPAAPQSSATI